ncbi:hypothetical protein [Salinisphaera sp.]|uniref:hypothetical protein n=1 Tax=Salinisphaera sp. TaxID=1914330 RepID=UPI002D76F18F|nr:hypothetical protein [Salinisphaera sp.]HET7314016.1 hypothetical protein [Salinisphaera sp.]
MPVPGIDPGALPASQASQTQIEDAPAHAEQLFQFMAQNAADGGAPQLSSDFMGYMRGFVQRTHDFESADIPLSLPQDDGTGPQKLSEVQFEPSASGPTQNAGGSGYDQGKAGDMDNALKALDGLKSSYTHALEIGLVSRGATQAAGAVRSLLRGR